MKTDVKIRMASEIDIDALMRLATAFRKHLGQSTPAATAMIKAKGMHPG